jgi:hypothetical protein
MEIPRRHPEQRPSYEISLSDTAREAIQNVLTETQARRQILTPGHILVGLANVEPEVYERTFGRYEVELVAENISQTCQNFIDNTGGFRHGIGGNALSAFEYAEREAEHSGRRIIETDDLLVGTVMQPEGLGVELLETLIGREGLRELRTKKMLDDVVYISERYRTTIMNREKRSIREIIQEIDSLSESSLNDSLTEFVRNPRRQFSTKVGVINSMRDAFTPPRKQYFKWQDMIRNRE